MHWKIRENVHSHSMETTHFCNNFEKLARWISHKKLYVRSHLDYWDRYNPNVSWPNKKAWTNAVLWGTCSDWYLGVAQTGKYSPRIWLGNSIWQRWYRHHVYTLKMMSSPNYFLEEIPSEGDISYNLRYAQVYHQSIPRTLSFFIAIFTTPFANGACLRTR